MSTQRPIGWRITSTYCRGCAPDGLRDSYAPMLEGADHGVPYSCSPAITNGASGDRGFRVANGGPARATTATRANYAP